MTKPLSPSIRALLPADAAMIRALHHDTFAAHMAREDGFEGQKPFIDPFLSNEAKRQSGLAALFGVSSRLVLVAEGTDGVAGYIAGARIRRWFGGRYADIADLTVAREARRRGVGRALLDAFEASVAGEGARRITATIWARNAASQALFERAGFDILRPTNAPLMIATKRIGGR